MRDTKALHRKVATHQFLPDEYIVEAVTPKFEQIHQDNGTRRNRAVIRIHCRNIQDGTRCVFLQKPHPTVRAAIHTHYFQSEKTIKFV